MTDRYPPERMDIDAKYASIVDAISIQRVLSNYAGMLVSFMIGFSNLLLTIFFPTDNSLIRLGVGLAVTVIFVIGILVSVLLDVRAARNDDIA